MAALLAVVVVADDKVEGGNASGGNGELISY